jgi:pyruvate, water dikinase
MGLYPEGRLFLLQTRPLEIRQTQPAPELLPGVSPLIQDGQTASSGTAHGVVHIVKKDVDILVLPDKAILVCVEATPKWAAVLNRCQGVIAEQGSVAGHLANVAREFNVPALFGVPRPPASLKPAGKSPSTPTTGPFTGLQEELLDRNPKRPNMMDGSPVFQTLLNVNRHITPLRLLDPTGWTSPRPIAGRCMTSPASAMKNPCRRCSTSAVTTISLPDRANSSKPSSPCNGGSSTSRTDSPAIPATR